MSIKILSAAALSLAMLSGAAFAQATSSTNPNEGPDPAMQKEMWLPFYTDDTFATMRADAEITTAWAALSAEDQARVKSACENDAPSPEEFRPGGVDGLCDKIGAL